MASPEAEIVHKETRNLTLFKQDPVRDCGSVTCVLLMNVCMYI